MSTTTPALDARVIPASAPESGDQRDLEYAMKDPALGTVAQRLDRLEHQTGRMKRAGVVTVVALAGVVAGLIFTAVVFGLKSRVVETEQLVLQDASGRLRATLSAARDEPSILFYGKDGTPRVKLAISGDLPGLELYDATGHVRAELRLEANGSPGLVMTESDGMVRVAVGVGREGSPILVLRKK